MSVISILAGQNRTIINDVSESKQGTLGKIKKYVRQSLGFITGIVVDATMSEIHSRRSEITLNPIEDGESVADHVNLKPRALKIEGVISDAPLGFAIISNVQNLKRKFTEILGRSKRSQDAFSALEDLWKSKKPFTIITSLKRYDNMIFTSLEFPIDITTGQCLKFSAEMEQVSIVKSRILQGIPTSDASSLVTGTKNFGQQVTQPVQAGSKVKEKIESQSFLSGITGLGS